MEASFDDVAVISKRGRRIRGRRVRRQIPILRGQTSLRS